ncbi:hypothetical protein QU487_00085 [Crenobacter sp. SG2305]|uniref:hypothetical protein n=1 Tax=Crenobacter oryzisoli TaxID=3056844 RepID=UPI0025AAFEF8|nr:hypothetical protein [Crenobacter sp. SG2305]MDN0081156.1 hypothetical protein [Crenobacter sp. SG2305]
MTAKTCFVIMAIGDQEINGEKLTYSDLKRKYDDLIKEAVLKARPNLDVVRADEISLPGTITTDIITRIMHSDYVIADVTFPNPNVFYELGLRHACRPGTVIIKDKSGPNVPFDIAHLRYVEYENSTAGLKNLASQLSTYFDHFDREPNRPDNHLLELAKLTNYEFQNYKKADELPAEVQAFMGLLGSPALLEMIVRQQSGESIDQGEIMHALFSNPSIVQPFLTAMVKSGDLSFSSLLNGNSLDNKI